jgi:hypothetical protein
MRVLGDGLCADSRSWLMRNHARRARAQTRWLWARLGFDAQADINAGRIRYSQIELGRTSPSQLESARTVRAGQSPSKPSRAYQVRSESARVQQDPSESAKSRQSSSEAIGAHYSTIEPVRTSQYPLSSLGSGKSRQRLAELIMTR